MKPIKIPTHFSLVTLKRLRNAQSKSLRSFSIFIGIVLLLLTGAMANVALAQKSSALPPLIDRQLFFGDPEISGAQLSPDGKFISFVKPFKGTRNIWVKRTEEPFGAARPITNDTKRPITNYFWSRDGKYILFVQDQLGDENYNVYAVDPAAEVAKDREVPTARNLTEAKGV